MNEMSGTDFGLGYMESSGQWNVRNFKLLDLAAPLVPRHTVRSSLSEVCSMEPGSRIKNMVPTRA